MTTNTTYPNIENTEENPNSISGIILPGFSTFVACSTLITYSTWASLFVAAVAGALTVWALYKNGKGKALPRVALVFLEVVGIICVAYSMLRQGSAGEGEGIILLIITLCLAVVLAFIEYNETRKEPYFPKMLSPKNRKYIKPGITFYMVMVGTYPLFVDFFKGFNHQKSGVWTIAAATIIAICSSGFQAYLINYEEDSDRSNKDQFKSKLFQWLGLTCISVELILSLANTAFSSNNSSVKELLSLPDDKWITTHINKIGFVLFIITVSFFLLSSLNTFKSHLKKSAIGLLNNYRDGFFQCADFLPADYSSCPMPINGTNLC